MHLSKKATLKHPIENTFLNKSQQTNNFPISPCYNLEKLGGVFMPTKETIQEVVRDVVKDYDIKEAYLFGSYARGEETPQSDIDLRFLCGKTLRIQDLYHIEKELEEKLGKSIEIISAPPKELRPRFYKRIKEDEVMLYAS